MHGCLYICNMLAARPECCAYIYRKYMRLIFLTLLDANLHNTASLFKVVQYFCTFKSIYVISICRPLLYSRAENENGQQNIAKKMDIKKRVLIHTYIHTYLTVTCSLVPYFQRINQLHESIRSGIIWHAYDHIQHKNIKVQNSAPRK
jgi:hypothetical protein